jgi:prepilin-type N-terminal cleavage/methylation domain-containing protein
MHTCIRLCRTRGFTLVELAIVLVIVGLIVGGVMVGQDLIEKARTRAVITQFEKHLSAVQAFKTKYNALPGDMPNATSIWGDAGDCGTSGTASTIQTATCNGNGNGIIGGGAFATCAGFQTGSANSFFGCVSRENFAFWQQMANAGLIEGNYSGAFGGATPGFVPEQNLPEAKYPCKNPRGCLRPNLTFHAWSQDSMSGSYAGTRYAHAPYYNTLSLASIESVGFYWLGMVPNDALYIDTKLDDGNPNNGKIVATQQTGNCYNLTTFVYLVTVATGDCSLNYKNAF